MTCISHLWSTSPCWIMKLKWIKKTTSKRSLIFSNISASSHNMLKYLQGRKWGGTFSLKDRVTSLEWTDPRKSFSGSQQRWPILPAWFAPIAGLPRSPDNQYSLLSCFSVQLLVWTACPTGRVPKALRRFRSLSSQLCKKCSFTDLCIIQALIHA